MAPLEVGSTIPQGERKSLAALRALLALSFYPNTFSNFGYSPGSARARGRQGLGLVNQ